MQSWTDRPRITVDALIIIDKDLLLVKRGNEPFQGLYALPGGFVEIGETTEEAIEREVFEETGIDAEVANLFGVYSTPDRDPRGHTISIVYELRKIGGNLKSGSDAKEVKLLPLTEIPHLAFDHDLIITDFKKKRKYD